MSEQPSADYMTVGEGAFTNGDVISYEGENYYRACGRLVRFLDDGGQSTCVKRVDHPNVDCEDWDGYTRNKDSLGVPECSDCEPCVPTENVANINVDWQSFEKGRLETELRSKAMELAIGRFSNLRTVDGYVEAANKIFAFMKDGSVPA